MDSPVLKQGMCITFLVLGIQILISLRVRQIESQVAERVMIRLFEGACARIAISTVYNSCVAQQFDERYVEFSRGIFQYSG